MLVLSTGMRGIILKENKRIYFNLNCFDMCLSPLTVFVRSSRSMSKAASYIVPCGKCVQCVSKVQNDWRFRLIQQTYAYPKAIFGTLTYSDDHVPVRVVPETGECANTVFKPHVQKWLHRSCEWLKRHGFEDTSYWLTSEYGTSTFRPHYHFMWWNISKIDFQHCLEDWEEHFGFTQCSDIDVARVASAAIYVSKYSTKGQFEVQSVKDGVALPNFHLVSNGIGLQYIKELESFIKRHNFEFDERGHRVYNEEFLSTLYRRMNYVTPQGQIFSLPRYYVNKIIHPKTPLARCYSDYVLQRRLGQFESRVRDIEASSPLTFGEAIIKAQQEKIAENRERAKTLLEKQSKFYYKSKL